MKHSFLHWFIPQEKNNYRASLLRTGTLLVLISFYIFNHSLINFIGSVKPGILGYSSEITAKKVFDQTNNERQKNGLPTLKYNSLLSESATKKAQDMFDNNYWAHTSPKGTTPWSFFKDVGYKYSVAGENLARDFYDTESLIKAWMNSPTHKENIINSKYQEIGIGVVNGVLGGVKTTLVVQHFGTPLINNASQNSEPNSQPASVPTTDSIKNNQENVNVVPVSEVLAQEQKTINPLLINKIISLILFSTIIFVLFIDGFISLKENHYRLTGSSVGHIGFLLVILLLIITTQQGNIF